MSKWKEDEMKIRTEEELLKQVGIEKIMTIERFRRRTPFNKEEQYEAEWALIFNKVSRCFNMDKQGIELSLRWDEIAEEHKQDFIDRFKQMHHSQRDLRF